MSTDAKTYPERVSSTFAMALFVIGLTVACIACALSAYEFLSIPARSFVPGKLLIVDHTLWAVLRRDSNPPKFLTFDRADVDTALADAMLVGTNNLHVDAVHVRAEPAEVSWSLNFGDQYRVDGLEIHARARVSAVHVRPGTVDTLMLRLPGLGALGARSHDEPRISLNGQEPVPGDSVIMQYYTHYASVDAMQRARRPYLAVAVLTALTAIALVVRAIVVSMARRRH